MQGDQQIDLNHFERALEALSLELKISDAQMFNLIAMNQACIAEAQADLIDVLKQARATLKDCRKRGAYIPDFVLNRINMVLSTADRSPSPTEGDGNG